MTTTANYLQWLDAELDDAATDLAEHRSLNDPSFADTAERMVDLMTARTMLREFIASQTPNTPPTLTD